MGRAPYRDVWQRQRELQRYIIDGGAEDFLILCEHDPVITLGRGAQPKNILESEESLRARGIDCIEIERGGDVTFHGPGQLVGYPILNLSFHRRDVGWYMRALEEVILRTLQELSIVATRVPGRTGVWTEHTVNDSVFSGLKIASIGVRISRWCTLHGFALNVMDSTEGFSLINPCGYTDTAATSIEGELKRARRVVPLDLWSVAPSTLERHFCEVFEYSTPGDTEHAPK